MNYADDVLGHYQAQKLRTTNETPVLIVGKDQFTRAQLSAVECFNFLAAARLTAFFKVRKVPSLKYVFNHVPPGELAAPMIGTISLAVLGAAFEAQGLGGEAPLTNWVKRHLTHVTTFDTIKKHAEAEQKEARRKNRKRGTPAALSSNGGGA